MEQKLNKFNDAMTRLLQERLRPFQEKKLDLVTCVEIYQKIFDTLAETITAAAMPLGNEAVNYLAQQYYDAVVINQNESLDPNIFTQRSKLENIDTKQLALLAVMLSGTDFAVPIIHEVKKRS